MQLVRSKDTTPEKQVRSLLHKCGFRFALHKKELPGSPDIVLPKYKTVVFVHGCFWHRHRGCKRASTPTSRQEYWLPKFQRTIVRDKSIQKQLRKTGWRVIIIWECELKQPEKLKLKLQQCITA
jgi:DNA mismatch endonuclease, patch repair protein